MKYSEGKIGRVFVVRLEDKDKLPDALERFAKEKNILRGMCIFIGGVGRGKIVVGPKDTESQPVVPLVHTLQGPHEVSAVGTIFPDENGKPCLHMHAAFGREGKTRTGCIRLGIEVASLGEVIILEIIDNTAKRKMDREAGFMVLEP